MMKTMPDGLLRTALGLLCLTAASLCGGPAMGQLPSGVWQYQWGDDFAGTTLDQTKWSYNYPWGTGHNHDAVMSPSNVRFGDGTMSLVATRTGSGADFTSGAVSTGYNKVTFNGGYIEARVLLPDTTGSWPAFWGLFDGWPPEADIMEYPIGAYAQDQYHTAFHYRNTSGGNSAGAGQVNPGSAGDLGGVYHTFGMEWIEDDWVGFYFDGQLVSQFGDDAAIAQMQQMYLILNYAVGGWPATPTTAQWPVGHSDEFKIDWVRVWEKASISTNVWTYAGPATNVQWDSASNWSGSAPNLGGSRVFFGTVSNAGGQFIDWAGRRTVSQITFDGSTRYRVGTAGNRLVLGYGNSGSMLPKITISESTSAFQQIDADLEFAGGLTITHDSGVAFLINGDISGDGGISIDGVGTVTFNGNNSYGGDTVIDAVGQGPASVRISGQDALGHGGTVVIGPAGNDTTARLELYGAASASNPVTLHGRNGATVGIANNSDSNKLNGTVTLAAGGGDYLVRSSKGLLSLTGTANGVSIDTHSGMGARTLVLDGAGDGAVGGAIQDAAGTTLSINKTGTGTWAFDGANTYAGTTDVAAGTLVVNGSTGAGATTVQSGATLAVSGSVPGALTAQAGSTLRVGGVGLPQVSTASLTLIDGFDQYPAGPIGATPNTTGNVWTGVFDGTANAGIVNNAGDLALNVHGTNGGSGWRGAVTDLRDGYGEDFSLADGETGTYFFRVRRNGAGTIDTVFGLTDQAAGGVPGADTDSPWDEYAALLSIAGDTNSSMLRAYSDGSGDVNLVATPNGQWVNVWLTVFNTTKTFRVATSTGADDGAFVGGAYQFGRRTGATVGTNPLVTFGIHEARNVDAELDDFYYASGIDLSNPLNAGFVTVGQTLTAEAGLTMFNGSTLELDVFDPALHDRLVVEGVFNADGTLRVLLDAGAPTPEAGDSFDLIDATTTLGLFDQLDLPALGSGLAWDEALLYSDGILAVVLDLLPGDTDGDGDVDNTDLQAAIANFTGPQTTPPTHTKTLAQGDTNGDGDVDNSDLQAAIASFTGPNQAAVPEPASAALLLVLTGPGLSRRRVR